LYCNMFCKQYLTVYEPRCMHWLQLKKEVADAYPGLKNSRAGYNYIENNMEMCEYHIDAIPDDDNQKENNGCNVLAELIAAGYIATKSV